jgi:hypothetical protein
MAAQREVFLWLDSDTLVLRPLDRLVAALDSDGFFAVADYVPLFHFHWGELAPMTGLVRPAASVTSFHTAVLGCDPARHGEVLAQAQQWAGRLTGRYYTEQALINLAWHKLRAQAPRDGGAAYCAGSGPVRVSRFALESAIVHLAALRWQSGGGGKAQYQLDIWNHWPRARRLQPLAETDFWRRLGPLPWQWPNQCNQHQYRAFVAAARCLSRELKDLDGVIIKDRMQAYLLDVAVLDQLDRYWTDAAAAFRGVPILPTYHLRGGGIMQPLWRARQARRVDDWLARIPRCGSGAAMARA